MFYGLYSYLSIVCGLYDLLAFKIFLLDVPNQNHVLGTYIYHKYYACTSFRSKNLHEYNVQVWLTVAAFLAFLNLEFWNCGKIWPSTFKWIHTCEEKYENSIPKLSGLWFGLYNLCWPFSFLLKSLMSTKASGMQKYHIKAL